jgi:two-component system sensor histidine kinase MprB
VNLRIRLALTTAGAVSVAALATAAMAYSAERADLHQAADADLRREVEAISLRLETAGPAAVVPADTDAPYRVHAQLVRPDGTVVSLDAAGTLIPVNDVAVDVAAGRGDRAYDTITVDGERLRVLTAPVPQGALVVARSLDDVQGLLTHLALILSLGLLAALGLAVVLGDVVARSALRPITALSTGAERLARDRSLRQRLAVDTPDELGQLASSVNSLLDGLDVAQQRQRRLVADAAHELRTPLTTVWTNLEVLAAASAQLPPAEVERIHSDIRAEVSGLMRAADDLLDLAREEPGDISVDEVSLHDVVADAVDAAQRSWPDVHVMASLTPVHVLGNRSRLWRAVRNLVDNAAKWSPTGGTVEVRLDESRLTVRDHGPGIPPGDLPYVFQRFYRADEARGRPGAGLGLAIVEKVVIEHGWRVTARNCEDGGAELTVHLQEPALPGLAAVGTAAAGTAAASQRSATASGLGGWVRRRPVVLGAACLVSGGALVALLALPTPPGTDLSTDLVTLAGVLERCGTQFCVGRAVVDFGPRWYVTTTRAPHDYDGDGTTELLAGELDGLVGTQVLLETDGGALDQDVFTVNGRPFRDSRGQLPPPTAQA